MGDLEAGGEPGPVEVRVAVELEEDEDGEEDVGGERRQEVKALERQLQRRELQLGGGTKVRGGG